MIVNFSKFLPKIPTLQTHVKVLLIFDANLNGYRDAVKWINVNKDENGIYRLVIPVSDSHKDYGDYIINNSTEELKGNASCFKPETIFDIQPISFENEPKEWPFPSKNRLIDFQKSACALEQRLFIRDAYSGLNEIQTFMLASSIKEREHIIAYCSVFFKIPMSKIKVEYHTLERGEYPILKHNNFCLPFALTNGPFPLDVVKTKDYIKQMIDTGKHPSFDELEPKCTGYRMENKQDGWYCENSKKYAPYYFSIQDQLTWAEPMRHMKCIQKIEWDPVFLQGRMTPNEVFDYWYQTRLQTLVNKRIEMIDAFQREERQKMFIRRIYCNETERDSSGHEFRIFTEESTQAKKRRLGDDVDFFNLPIGFLDEDYIYSETEPIPHSARDLLLNEILNLSN